jgi:glycosyltransferase involved in cell wall biosynthesis
MKILFIFKSEKTPSSRVRGLDILPFLSESGLECESVFFPRAISAKLKLYSVLKSYDAVLLQKRLPSWLDFREIRKRSKRLIFDFDDAIFLKNAAPSSNLCDYESSTRMRKFKRVIEGVDEVVAANSFLAEAVKKIAPEKKVHIIPSPVSADKYEQKENYELSCPPVIGWIGTESTLRYLDMTADTFREIRKKKDFVLRIISDGEYSPAGIKVENIRWSLERQFCEIRKFDIGIMPLSPDPFSEGKSAYKLLQYLAAGVPSVCSPVGMNCDVAGNDEFALIAGSSAVFAEKILFLLENYEIRKRLGQKGRELIKERFDLPVVARQWEKILRRADARNPKG